MCVCVDGLSVCCVDGLSVCCVDGLSVCMCGWVECVYVCMG